MASNRHEGLAVRYLIAALVSSAACLGLTYVFGLEGAAFSIVIMDLILIPYVINYSLKIIDDNWNEFLPGILNFFQATPILIIKNIFKTNR
jgi:hypothetical protein